jgi:hypothetical protein
LFWAAENKAFFIPIWVKPPFQSAIVLLIIGHTAVRLPSLTDQPGSGGFYLNHNENSTLDDFAIPDGFYPLISLPDLLGFRPGTTPLSLPLERQGHQILKSKAH